MNIAVAHLVSSDFNGTVDRLTLQIVRATTALDFEMEYWLAEVGEAGPGRSCGLRASAFKAFREKLKSTDKQKAQIDERVTALNQAIEIRNALVHGRIESGEINGVPHLFVETVEQHFSPKLARHCLRVEHVEQAICSIRELTQKLGTFRSQREQSKLAS